MKTAFLTTIAKAVDGELIGENIRILGVSTDTRSIKTAELFIALIGDKFDGHHFAEQAIINGASALMVSRLLPFDVPQIIVRDTTLGLQRLGAWNLAQCRTKTIAITGSCGKTTVKEMTANILALSHKVVFTQGNFNNDIGVPLTLLRVAPSDDIAVIELGANHIGEIAHNVQFVHPQIALVNNVDAAHLEGFGSIEGVKQAKGEIYTGLKAKQKALINLNSHGGHIWQDVLADKDVISFSATDESADFYASHVRLNEKKQAQFTLHSPIGECDIELSLIGAHNVSNALAAAALSAQLGATTTEIQRGLSTLAGVKGRVNIIKLRDNIDLIDDAYNASVPAMKAGIELLATFDNIRWLVLGNMAELGQFSQTRHKEVAKLAASIGFEYVLTYGEEARIISQLCQKAHPEKTQAIHFDAHSAMIAYLSKHLTPSTHHTLLIKGANSSGMAHIVAALEEIYS